MISETKEKILKNLAKYKYLTVSQMVNDLGLNITPERCRTYLNELRTDFGFTDRLTQMAIPQGANKDTIQKRVRHQDLHYLVLKGAKFLDGNTELSLPDIRFARKAKHTLSNDYFHRISTVSINISFDKWIEKNEYTNSEFLVYYDKRGEIGKGDDFKSETRLDFTDGRHYSPDVLCRFYNKDKEPFIFVLEVYNGNRTKYAFEQLKKLFWIIENTTTVADKLNVQKIPRILCVFDNPTLLKNVCSAIKNEPFFDIEGLDELLYFALDTDVWSNFGNAWEDINQKKVHLNFLKTINF